MSAPGWYPDPDGSPRLRYFDGQQWTPQTSPQQGQPPVHGHPPNTSPSGQPGPSNGIPPGQGLPSQGQPTGFQQHTGGAGDAFPSSTPHPPGNNANRLWMWIVLAVVVVLIIAVASWLVLRPTPSATPGPTPAQATSAPPSSEEPTTEEPTTEQPTTAPEDPTPEPTPPITDPDQMVMLPPPGTIIEPIAGCPTTASDAVGEQGADERYTSGAGLSMPAADGFVASAVQYPWVHESNSQVKQYGESWMAAVTVGTVRTEDGFTDTTTTAVAVVACMLGSDFYESVDPVATVGNASRSPEDDVVAMSIDVTVQGVENVNSDLLYIMTIKVGDVMHVVISTVPDTDRASTDAVGAVVADVRIR